MRIKIILLTVSLIAVTAAISFGIVRSTTNTVTAQEKVNGDGTSVQAMSLDDAARIAGYKVVTLNPSVVALLSTASYTIDVQFVGPDPKAPLFKAVVQDWQLQDGAWVHFVQAPGLDIAGESVDVANTVGGRLLYKAEGETPAKLSLYWQVGNMGYSLSGILTGIVNEDLLTSLANSTVNQ